VALLLLVGCSPCPDGTVYDPVTDACYPLCSELLAAHPDAAALADGRHDRSDLDAYGATIGYDAESAVLMPDRGCLGFE
jgi:hypothetical protein